MTSKTVRKAIVDLETLAGKELQKLHRVYMVFPTDKDLVATFKESVQNRKEEDGENPDIWNQEPARKQKPRQIISPKVCVFFHVNKLFFGFQIKKFDKESDFFTEMPWKLRENELKPKFIRPLLWKLRLESQKCPVTKGSTRNVSRQKNFFFFFDSRSSNNLWKTKFKK